jgi:flagellar hook protein FlgE
MSIYGGLYSGVSALAAQSTAFGIISDNIANVNTIGYKESSAQFQTLVTESQTASRYSPGGVLSRPFTDPEKQGLIQGTTSETDLAIIGNGFFVVNEAAAPEGQDRFLFTRAGSFEPDEDGNLRNTAGYYLQGWLTDQSGNIVNSTTQDLLTSLETVSLSGFTSTANNTDNITLSLNLPATASIGSTETTNLNVFDSLGVNHLFTVNWEKTAANTWDYSIDLTNSAGTVSAGIQAGTIVFNGDGTLGDVDGVTTSATGAATTTVALTSAQFATGSNASSLVINWGNYDQTNGIGQLADGYQASLLNQDGSGPSSLTKVEIGNDGFVTAIFANGESRPIYKLAMAQVPAASELNVENGNAYSLSSTSGELVLSEAGEQGAGTFESTALEGSTVDISDEFTDLIVTQRAYSAATRIITTGDELLDEIIRIKR